MNYIGSNLAINWLFVLACLSLLQWLLTIYFVYTKFDLIGKNISKNAFIKESHNKVSDYKTKIPFLKDYFYIYWNIYPIVFYAFFYYLDTSWQNHLNQIIMIGGDTAKEIYKNIFIEFSLFGYNIKHIWIDIIIIISSIIIACLGTFGTQLKKQRQYLKEIDKLYWWDIRISKKLFWIRFIFLFFNLILVAFIAYMGIKVVLFVTAILSTKLIINPLHPDGFGGLGVLMDITSVILSIYLLRGTMGIIGLIDHKGVKDKAQLLGDLYHTAYIFLGLGFVVYFIYKANKILDKIDISKLLSYNNYKMLQIDFNNTNMDKIVELSDKFSNYYEPLIKFNKFPIDLSLFTGSIFTFVLPLILWFSISFIENRSNEISYKIDKR